MHILFIADPLDTFKIYKDTTFAMMREAQKRGHTLSACEPKDIMWQRGNGVVGVVTAFVRDITLTGDKAIVRSIQDWLGYSVFDKEKRRVG